MYPLKGYFGETVYLLDIIGAGGRCGIKVSEKRREGVNVRVGENDAFASCVSRRA